MPVFTAETARIAAHRSHDSRKASAERLKQLEAVLAERSNLPLVPAELPVQRDEFSEREIQRTRTQLDLVNAALDVCNDSKEWDALTRAKERLARWYAHLAQIPGPGQYRPERAKSNLRQLRSIPDAASCCNPVAQTQAPNTNPLQDKELGTTGNGS